MKVGISSPISIPAVAICDPELTVSCPRAVTAAAGARCPLPRHRGLHRGAAPATPELSRERVFVGTNVLTDLFALEAGRSVAAHLQRACDVPDDLDARSGMMRARPRGRLRLRDGGTAAAHALQYPIGALTHTSHGAGVGALIPYVMAFNAPERVEKLGEIARAIGADGGSPIRRAGPWRRCAESPTCSAPSASRGPSPTRVPRTGWPRWRGTP